MFFSNTPCFSCKHQLCSRYASRPIARTSPTVGCSCTSVQSWKLGTFCLLLLLLIFVAYVHSPQPATLFLQTSTFTIGKTRECDLQIHDPRFAEKPLCRFAMMVCRCCYFFFCDSSFLAASPFCIVFGFFSTPLFSPQKNSQPYLLSDTNHTPLLINGRQLRKAARQALHSGDEIYLMGAKNYQFVASPVSRLFPSPMFLISDVGCT